MLQSSANTAIIYGIPDIIVFFPSSRKYTVLRGLRTSEMQAFFVKKTFLVFLSIAQQKATEQPLL